MIQISKTEAKDMVKNYKGSQFFTVTFTKRSNGQTRVMNCRKGVLKGVEGQGQNYDPDSKNLVCVFDAKVKVTNKDKGFRMIALEDIQKIKMKGLEYKVE